MGKTFVLPWLDTMGAYLGAGNSPINVMGCSVQNPSQNYIGWIEKISSPSSSKKELGSHLVDFLLRKFYKDLWECQLKTKQNRLTINIAHCYGGNMCKQVIKLVCRECPLPLSIDDNINRFIGWVENKAWWWFLVNLAKLGFQGRFRALQPMHSQGSCQLQDKPPSRSTKLRWRPFLLLGIFLGWLVHTWPLHPPWMLPQG